MTAAGNPEDWPVEPVEEPVVDPDEAPPADPRARGNTASRGADGPLTP